MTGAHVFFFGDHFSLSFHMGNQPRCIPPEPPVPFLRSFSPTPIKGIHPFCGGPDRDNQGCFPATFFPSLPRLRRERKSPLSCQSRKDYIPFSLFSLHYKWRRKYDPPLPTPGHPLFPPSPFPATKETHSKVSRIKRPFFPFANHSFPSQDRKKRKSPRSSRGEKSSFPLSLPRLLLQTEGRTASHIEEGRPLFLSVPPSSFPPGQDLSVKDRTSFD